MSSTTRTNIKYAVRFLLILFIMYIITQISLIGMFVVIHGNNHHHSSRSMRNSVHDYVSTTSSSHQSKLTNNSTSLLPPSLIQSQLQEPINTKNQINLYQPIRVQAKITFHHNTTTIITIPEQKQIINNNINHTNIHSSQEGYNNPNSNNNQNSTDFLAFLRISKTASTSILQLLRHSNGKLHTANAFLQPNHYFSQNKGILECIFAPFTRASNYSIHFKRGSAYKYKCPHPGYGFLKQKWIESLEYMMVDDLSWLSDNSGGISSGDYNFNFHPFTMIRDPYERMVSFFYYMQAGYPHWTSTEKQDAKILENDFIGWLSTIDEENHYTGIVGLPYSYQFIDQDLDTALELIAGDTPEILVLISDHCVETSIRLLAELKPHFFQSSALVESFIQSPKSKSNQKKILDDEKSNNSSITNTTTKSNEFNQTLARRMHMTLFSEDWEFYNASLSQMKKILLYSNLNSSHIDYVTCLNTLDEKLDFIRDFYIELFREQDGV